MVKYHYTTVTATASILTLEKAKVQLAIEPDFVLHDDLIKDQIDSAQESCQLYINRSIAERKLVLEMDSFATPITFERNYENDTITKIEYYVVGETTLTELDPSKYKLRKSNTVECFDIIFLAEVLALQTDKRDDAVIVTIAQGFTAESCPKSIIQAMKLKVSDYYERREDRESGNNSAGNNLLRPLRKY
jgi:hypothetical protein